MNVGAVDQPLAIAIGNVRHSTLTREENLELFYGTFEDQANAILCEPCAEAVLDAAGE